jgi:uncharacterized coiled-coil DUF342 family protein
VVLGYQIGNGCVVPCLSEDTYLLEGEDGLSDERENPDEELRRAELWFLSMAAEADPVESRRIADALIAEIRSLREKLAEHHKANGQLIQQLREIRETAV